LKLDFLAFHAILLVSAPPKPNARCRIHLSLVLLHNTLAEWKLLPSISIKVNLNVETELGILVYFWELLNKFGQRHKEMWKRNGNTTTLLLSPKGLQVLDEKRREEMNTIVMEHFKRILFYKSEHANKQHTYQSINQSINQSTNHRIWIRHLSYIILV
jgi:hypothetical protein